MLTKLCLKDDPTWEPRTYRAGGLNATKLLPYILKSKKISDEKKAVVCESLRCGAATAWLSNYEARSAKKESTPAATALVAAKEVAKTGALKEEEAQMRTLAHFGIQSCSTQQALALSFLLARFFFLCVIPFMAVEHWAFRALIAALAPAYLKLLPSRKTLSRNWLPKMFAST